MRRPLIAIVALALPIGLAACGDDDDTATSNAAAAADDTATTTTAHSDESTTATGEASTEDHDHTDEATAEDHDHTDEATAEDHDHTDEATAEDHDHADEGSADLAALVEDLNPSALHEVDEALNGGTYDEGIHLPIVEHALDVATTAAWPPDVDVTEITAALTALRDALVAGDVETAAPLATEIHDLAHGLEPHDHG